MNIGEMRQVRGDWTNADAGDLYYFLINEEEADCVGIFLPYEDKELEQVRMQAFANAAKKFQLQVGERLYSPGDDAVLEVLSIEPKKSFLGNEDAMLKIVSGKVTEKLKFTSLAAMMHDIFH